ncbi:MAG TPA: DUF1501 domain-containing protein [Sphingomicrobium sp.]|nr:DUF1501 domain-containing protein [Sphingomicrobium sp.]
MLTRRFFLGAGGATTALASLGFPRVAFARANTPRRFVFIIQRGAADGLHIVAPTGDPQFAGIRGDFAQDLTTGAKLGGFFTLHPALAEAAKMYAAREALFVHAVASPYRDRSHFDGQNVLETGGSAAYRLKDGWMNRLLGLLPQETKALALSDTVPMALRGSHEVGSYSLSKLPSPSDDLLARVAELYEPDPQLHALWSTAMQTRMTAGTVSDTGGQNGAAIGALAAKMLAGETGARIAMIETNGWDTHAAERGRLAAQLRGLDLTVAAMKSGLGADWANTLVIVATEFGRTVHPNGTGGTDHGQASAAMLLGGAVAGGKVLADWPGLSPGVLYEGRDLKPTIDLDALIAGALAQHYALEPARVMTTLFPENRGLASRQQLIA